MWKLTFQLAVTNLKKNRRLYSPFALMGILSASLAYIFLALRENPYLEEVYGARSVGTVLGFGLYVVLLAVGVMVFYANSFVMKHRSKEIGVYQILGLEKQHLLLMNGYEILLFALVTTLLGLLLGISLDSLFYAILLKLIQAPVVLVSSFQWGTVGTIGMYFLALYMLLFLWNSLRIGLTSSLQMVKGKKKGEKKGRFLWLQTLFGLSCLVLAYYLAITIVSPTKAMEQFFQAVLLVILATYLLFQAGSISLLMWLQKRQTYYYKPSNFISLSNLIFRMKKNAMGLATISILSTMFLVTLIGGTTIYTGGKEQALRQVPHDFEIGITLADSHAATEEQLESFVREKMDELSIPITELSIFPYKEVFLSDVTAQQVTLFGEDEWQSTLFSSEHTGVLLAVSQEDYRRMTGENLDLQAGEVAVYSKGQTFVSGQQLEIGEKKFKVGAVLDRNGTIYHLPDYMSLLLNQYLVLVLPDLSHLPMVSQKSYAIGVNTSLSAREQMERYDSTMFLELTDSVLKEELRGSIQIANRAQVLEGYFDFAGSLLFIGILLSLVFLMATILVIYYKQISEGYEDKGRFSIMRKVGLDQDQTKRSIRKQLVTVFFLPIGFAFLHLAFAYKMLSRILSLMCVLDPDHMLKMTVLICLGYFLVYLLVYRLTAGSYRRIIEQG